MRYLVNGRQMKEIDGYTIDKVGIPSMVLMERAALSVVEEVERRADRHSVILSVCGTGNNGADGIAVARILYQRGYDVVIILAGVSECGTQEYQTQLAIAKKIGIHMGRYEELVEYTTKGICDVVIDALFGIGLSRPPAGEYYDLIEKINLSDAFVISVDIPSGISADLRNIAGIAVKADLTVTFGYEKLGMVFYPAVSHCGRCVIKDIGLASLHQMQQAVDTFTYEKEDLRLLPMRPANANKGTFGRLLVIAGGVEMCGAAYLCARAAYRMGAGLVEVLTPKENGAVLKTMLPEAIVTGYDAEVFSIEQIKQSCEKADAVVMGPGVGTDSHVRSLLNYILQYVKKPIVLDADALNILAANPQMTEILGKHLIITPHVKEMARLTGRSAAEISCHVYETAKAYSERYGVTCVLKDAKTVVSTYGTGNYINQTGNEGMATGGSGDVLAGIIGGLAVQKMELFMAASLGVYLHGLAGDRAKEKLSSYAVMAGDIIEMIGEVLAEAEKKHTDRS